QVEEERRLMFVGITRAREELQISYAFQRDFRGQRKITIPSRFLMDLPRREMETVDQRDHARPSDRESPAAPVFAPAFAPAATTCSSTPSIRLTTAAELAGDAVLPAVDPDEFTQDMIVRHNQFGLGRIAAISGNGTTRTA